ncbi:FG-GAP repeat domain-containing protein [Engelhardtia mirabilis]|uniref:FG-GAP repeat protein n=1 Tax=Engelhardtia mirabilis TaxID=2528011 RepID=A0A518BG45_9BACT|nr:hypothetical protein Pla133_10160 [Planctomycetes bacterium Pla133]QDV00276.1 hypothetical protein Pla86_10150 [Planctomycetes bacterium Pla86]
MPRSFLALAALVTLAPAVDAQVFLENTTAIPQDAPANNSNSEEVEFSDVDLDGDWDAGFADGGDYFNDQNRLWINQGGLQTGASGTFVDETATRFPTVNDASRDLDFADIDDDGDPDAYIANHAGIVNQTSKFWINTGGEQAGTLGYFVDETASRWVGLGGPGSSIAPTLVLPGGGFIDWSADGDFADLDNDGDLDLIHTSYGGAFGGQVPTRLFLNDGDGYFTEFNPSGFQLASVNIATGDPALWADGVQLNNTTDTTGVEADITTNGTDAEVYDIDGDLDLDLLLGAVNGPPRFFGNKLQETGSLGFRDVTAVVLPLDDISPNGKYEVEVGDLDGDRDIDIIGINWGQGPFGYNEGVYELVGTSYTYLGDLPNSWSDDEEGELLDFDNDGDLDVFIANFSGIDRLYENGDSGPVFGLVEVPAAEAGLASSPGVSRDADAADVDGDGDLDLFVTLGTPGSKNRFFENLTQVPDSTPPRVFGGEDLGDAPAAPGVRSIRVAVLDNAPQLVTAAATVEFTVRVDGVTIAAAPAKWSGGQVFRAEVPANLVGPVTLLPRAIDEGGNQGFGTEVSYQASGSAGTSFGASTPSSAGTPKLRALSVPFPGEDLWLGVSDLESASAGFFGLGTQAVPGGLALGDGLVLNVLGSFLVLPALAYPNGDALFVAPIPPGLPSGVQFHAQYVALGGTLGATFASSAGLTLTIP